MKEMEENRIKKFVLAAHTDTLGAMVSEIKSNGNWNPHGLANAVVMPYIFRSYGEVIYKKLHHLGIAAGVCSQTDSEQEGAEKFITAIESMNRRMGIPGKITGILGKFMRKRLLLQYQCRSGLKGVTRIVSAL